MLDVLLAHNSPLGVVRVLTSRMDPQGAPDLRRSPGPELVPTVLGMVMARMAGSPGIAVPAAPVSNYRKLRVIGCAYVVAHARNEHCCISRMSCLLGVWPAETSGPRRDFKQTSQ